MRKIILIAVLSVICAFCFVGCDGCNEENKENSKPQQNGEATFVMQDTSVSLAVGETKKLTINGITEDTQILWYTYGTAAKVDDNGNVTGLAPAKTTVYAQIGEKVLSCEVTVYIVEKNYAYLALENEIAPYTLRLVVGEAYTLCPYVMDAEKIKDITATITTTSSAITVSGTTITATSEVENEKVTVSCEYGGKTLTVEISVSAEVKR